MVKKSFVFILCVITTLAITLTAMPIGLAVTEVKSSEIPTGWSALLSVNSPSNVLTVTLYTNKDGKIGYTVDSTDGRIIEFSNLGIVTTDCDMSRGLKFNNDLKIESVTDKYTLISDKKDAVSDACNQAVFSFTKDGKYLTVTFRVYDNCAAHRYSVDGEGEASITGEISGCSFNDNATVT